MPPLLGGAGTGHDLLLEIIVDQPQTREEQDACLLRWMRRCYELGVYPDYWKILPVADQGTWQAIEALIGEYDPYCRGILFLGLNVAEAELVKRFAALPESPRALGFAIGRSIFLEPARKWFAGQMSDEDAVATMRDCFLRLARAWNGATAGSFSGAARPRTPRQRRCLRTPQGGKRPLDPAWEFPVARLREALGGNCLFIRNTDKTKSPPPQPRAFRIPPAGRPNQGTLKGTAP